TPPQPPRLLDLVRQVARARFGQDGPGERYADWARRLILFHQKRHPRDLLLADVRSFREHVAPTAKAPLRCLDEAHTALTFLYHEVLGLDVEDSGGWRTRVGLGWLEPFSRGSNGARSRTMQTKDRGSEPLFPRPSARATASDTEPLREPCQRLPPFGRVPDPRPRRERAGSPQDPGRHDQAPAAPAAARQ